MIPRRLIGGVIALAAVAAAPAATRAESQPSSPTPLAMAAPNAQETGASTGASLRPTSLTPPIERMDPALRPALPTGYAARILEALETTAPIAAGNAGDPMAAALRAFYAARGFQPIWTSPETGPLPRASALWQAVQAADEDGLEPADYLTQGEGSLFLATDEADLARLEAALSWAYVRLASDLASGRTVPSEVDPEHYVHPIDIDPAAALAAAAAADDIGAVLAGNAPQTEDYRRLKAALKTYRSIQRLGGWTLMSSGEILRPGDSGRRIAELRRVLAERGEALPPAPSPAAETVYGPDLESAVTAFQQRHGLKPDGHFGPNSLRALNASVGQRIEQIKINMERRRWMPDHLGARYAFVNLADFRLEVKFDEETVFETRVVVGREADRTPVFSDKMTYLVINPYWNIPPSIARDEMLPQLRKDPYALLEKGIRVFSGWGADAVEIDPGMIDWTQVSRRRFPFKLRQDPGDQNALGRVKFMFPNHFNIYLHDTPSKSLFERTVRTFSHGCIRVEDPLRLARLLLAGDPMWPEGRLEEQIASNERRTVGLRRPIEVHLTYLTAWVDDAGVVQFRNDVYGRDRRLLAALDASRETPAVALNAETPAAGR